MKFLDLFKRQASPYTAKRAPLAAALEPRMLFDGAVAATVADAAANQPTATPDAQESTATDTSNHDGLAATPTAGTADQRQEVVFIDGQVTNKQQLIDGLAPGTEVVVLDSSQDGLQQIADYLKGRSDVDAIHLLSHGTDGTVELGNTWLNAQNIGQHSQALDAIGAALATDGDILVYGCNTAEDTQGTALLNELARLTRADVAASVDATGAADKGGNWQLERQVGQIESTSLNLEGYQSLLAAPADQSFDNPVIAPYEFTGSETINGVTYSLESPAGGMSTITANPANFTITPEDVGMPYGYDLALIFNINSANDAQPGPLDARISSADGSEFSMVSMEIDTGAFTPDPESPSATNPNLTIKGYLNGVEVASDTVNTGVSDASGSITYTKNAIAAGFGGTLTFSSADWGYIDEIRITGTDTVVAIDDLNFAPAAPPNAVPVVSNLNGDSVSYTEGSTQVLLDQGSNATVSDADSSNFNGGKLTVQVNSGGTSGEDVLFVRNQGNGTNEIQVDGTSIKYNGLVIGAYTGGTNGTPLVITLTSEANATTTAALVHNLAYSNSNTIQPSTTTRSVSISMDDGAGGNSAVSVVSVAVLAVNDAPVVNTTGTNPTFTENGSAVVLFSGTTINNVETGQLVKQMVFTVSNVADGSLERLTIDGTTLNLINGTNVVTLNNSATVTVSLASGTATVTLTHSGLASSTSQVIVNNMTYRNTSESPTGLSRVVTLSSVTDNSGTTNGGNDTAIPGVTSTVTLVAVNDAPTLSGGPYALASVNEDTTTSGYLVSTVLAGLTTGDLDSGALSGIAITAASGRGTWQYSTDGSTWTDFGTVSNSSALLLTSTSQVRYIPDGANGENANLIFRAWDRTSGSASTSGVRSTADTTSNGGSTAFSTGTAQATLIVTSINDAPFMSTVTPTLTGLTDTSTNNGGNTVLSLLGGVTDVDNSALKGMAITGVTGTYGTWQYSIDGGGTWGNVGAVSVTSALMLASQNLVRFVPDGIHGETATITYKAWDQTNSTLGFQGIKANTTTSGGTSTFSTSTDTATVVVTGVNDRPVVTVNGNAAIWTEGNNVASDRIVVDSALTVSDPDGPNPTSATVRLLTYYSAQDSLAFVNDGASMGNIIGSWNAGSGILTLTSAGNQATTAQFQAAMRAVTYGNSSDLPNSTTRTVQFQLTDGGGLSSIAVTRDITITAVNDSPVNNVPGAQTASENVALGFNTANGNAISITDVDAGNGLMTVTLTATNGVLSLGSLTGINMVSGTGLNNATMTFEGNRTDINAALQTLTFRPTNNYLGAASVTIETNDNGNSGTGGAKSDVDTISINVTPVNPKVTNVSAQGLDRTVKIGDEVLISMTWNQVVNVDLTSGIPSLLLETGLIDRNAVYLSGSGSSTLVFKYIVQAGDITADLDFQSTTALQMNGAVMSNNTSDLAILTLPTVGGADSLGGRSNIVVDGMVPVVGSVSVPTDGTYIPGQNLDFTVNFSEAMTVDTSTGVPRIAVTLDTGGTVHAEYVSGSGGSALVFRMVVQSGQLDSNGITLGSSIDTNGGAITDLAGNSTVTTLNGVAALGGVNVDGVAPTVVSVVPPADGSYKAGDVLTFTVNASENVQTGALPPRLVLDIGGETRYATYVSGTGSSALVFQYVVQAGDSDSNGIAVNSLDLRGEPLTDLAGNNLNLTLNNMSSTAGVLVDTTAPSASGIVRIDATPTNNGSVSFSVTFSEGVSGVDASDFTLSSTGTASGNIASVTRVNGSTWTVLVDNLSGVGSLGLNLNGSGTGIVDDANNAVTGGLTGATYTVDRVAPSVVSVDVPASGTYVAGQNLDFTVNLNENVTVDTSGGTPRIAVTLDTGGTVYAEYLSGSGSSALVFRLTVASGQMDSNGISVGSSIDANGGTLRDTAGNNSTTILNAVASTAGVLVDAIAPDVSAISLDGPSPTNASSVTFTVTFSEDVSGVDLNDFSLSTNGSVSAALQSVLQLNAHTYQVTVDSITGLGGLAVMLNTNGSAIVDSANNPITGTFTGPAYTIGLPPVTTPDVTGDPEFRANPPGSPPVPPSAPLQPTAPSVQPAPTHSPLMPPALFEVPTLGSGIPTLGNIFINNGALSPSFIAQVFASSDSTGNGSGSGFLGFGGGDGGVFGSSALSSIFGNETLLDSSPMKVFDGKNWRSAGDINEGLRGVFGAPTLGQQLHDLNEGEQRQLRELALALGQFEFAAPNA